MITEFIDKFQEIKPRLLEQFSKEEPDNYSDIFKQTIKMMFEDTEDTEDTYFSNSETPDFERITVIDDGDYQGTLVFVVASKGYQPSDYWATQVDYGSCSGCDTFQSYSDYDNPEKSAPKMVTMALHMIESMKKIF
jgi:hypothetical protein